MNTTAIKNYAVKARRDFRKLVTEKLNSLGIGADGKSAPTQEAGDALLINGVPFPISIRPQRNELLSLVKREGFEQVVESMAYTLFNRFCALRYMEVHEYLPQRVFTSKNGGGTPDILANAVDAIDQLGVESSKAAELRDMKLRGDQDQELYKQLILAQCNGLFKPMPFLFETPKDMTELLMPDNLLHSDSVVRELVENVPEADWQDIEIVGWLYQFYISEKKDEVVQNVKRKEDIPAATQVFTPEWIVRYMVENSLGRLWLEVEPNSSLLDALEYYIDTSEANPGHVPPKHEHIKSPEDITLIDPACGSGHILVYAFDVLFRIYEEHGYVVRDIPALILKHNLYGIDIDRRAAQLASFALMMKARSRDRRFFDRGVLPNVIEIIESNGYDVDRLLDADGEGGQVSPFADSGRLIPEEDLLPVQRAKRSEPTQLREQLRPLFRFFHDAKNYGALLRVPDSLTSRLPVLQSELGSAGTQLGLFDSAGIGIAYALVRQMAALARQYDVCVANPPYMGGLFRELKDFAREEYPDSKSDLCTMFIERNLTFLEHSGFVSMVTIPNWMFLSSFEALRDKLYDSSSIVTLCHNGRGVWGADFGSCSFSLRKASDPALQGAYQKLFRAPGEVRSNSELEERFRDREEFAIFHASSSHFRKIPGVPVAYWVSERVADLFAQLPSLSETGHACSGLQTGDNDLYLRQWHEVAAPNTALWVQDSGPRMPARWLVHRKGGVFRRWYGNLEFVLDWGDDGRSIRENPSARPQNTGFWFKPAVSWSHTSISLFSARYAPVGSTFNVEGPSFFSDDAVFATGLMCSAPFFYLMQLMNPTLHFLVGSVCRVPTPTVTDSAKQTAIGVAEQAIGLATRDWDAYERSWDFRTHPLLTASQECRQTAQSCYAAWRSENREATAQMERIEEENNRLFIEAYGLQGEMSPEVPLEQITLTGNPVYRYGAGKTEEEYEQRFLEDTMKEFVSYAIGCMMGRYSLDHPGLIFAGGDFSEVRRQKSEEAGLQDVYQSFPADEDGIIPVLADPYFEDDCTNRLIRFLTVTYSKETLNGNLQFLARALGMKKSETPTDAIRRYLATKFFKDHLKTYKKRPIYWLISSGKQRAFQALVYMHRYTPATLSRMRTSYLHELQNKLRARMDDVSAGVEEATTASQSNRLNKELTALRKQQAELVEFDEKLHHYADQRIEIDLDDGIKHNYGLFGDLLAEVKAVTGKKPK